jgi:hypothetical protein
MENGTDKEAARDALLEEVEWFRAHNLTHPLDAAKPPGQAKPATADNPAPAAAPAPSPDDDEEDRDAPAA